MPSAHNRDLQHFILKSLRPDMSCNSRILNTNVVHIADITQYPSKVWEEAHNQIY